MERNTNGQQGRFKSKILVIKYKLTKRSIFKTKKKIVMLYLKLINCS